MDAAALMGCTSKFFLEYAGNSSGWNIPHSARYALHKLIVFGERSGTFAVKSNKDLLQAACLLSLYKHNRPWEVEEAWIDLLSRGKGWSTRATRGLQALDKAWPEIQAAEWLKPAD